MNRSALFILILYGSLMMSPYLPASAKLDKDEPVMEELLEVMRQFGIGEKDYSDSKMETTTDAIDKKPPQDAMAHIQDENAVCPSVNDAIVDRKGSLKATCTEITYECTNSSHVLVFHQNDEICMNTRKAFRHCDKESGFESPACLATCNVPPVDHANWKLVQQFQNLVINNATVLTGSRILYICDAGYKRTSATEDNEPLVCDENGVLIGEFISCEATQKVTNVTECGGDGGEWTRIFHLDMEKEGSNKCPPNWQKTERQGIVGCTSKVRADCSPIHIEVGDAKFSKVCGRAVGYQIAFPDAFAVANTMKLNHLYVDGLSITYGFPPTHVWTYGVGASKGPLFGTNVANCPCQNGEPQPYFVGQYMYCDSGHRTTQEADIQQAGTIDAILYSEIHNRTLWTDPCGVSANTTCCGAEYRYRGVEPPWFRRDNLKSVFESPDSNAAKFQVRLCTHEVDMQEGALLTHFELYIQK